MIHIDDFGRSLNISKEILSVVKNKNVFQVSVLLGFVNESLHQQLRKSGVQTRLHLNLTENVEFFSPKFTSLNFFKLVFANKKMKSLIKEEIDRQLLLYNKIYKPIKVRVDRHLHVHFIPWIYKYLLKNRICKIYELRYAV